MLTTDAWYFIFRDNLNFLLIKNLLVKWVNFKRLLLNLVLSDITKASGDDQGWILGLWVWHNVTEAPGPEEWYLWEARGQPSLPSQCHQSGHNCYAVYWYSVLEWPSCIIYIQKKNSLSKISCHSFKLRNIPSLASPLAIYYLSRA